VWLFLRIQGAQVATYVTEWSFGCSQLLLNTVIDAHLQPAIAGK
jgi:hypothetical protein